MEKSVQPPPPAGGHGHHSFRGGIAGAHIWVLALLALGSMLFLTPAGKAQRGGQTSSTPPLTGTGAPSGNCGVGSLYVNTSTGNLYDCNGGSWLKVTGGGGGSGTVTQVTSGNFSPLFNVSVATNTTTPAFSFATINQSANTVYGNCTGSTGAPAFCALTSAMLPTLSLTANGQTCTIGSACNVNSGAAAHSVALNQGNGNALTGPALGNAGQVFESNGPGADPSFQDPIVSYAYVNLWTTQDVTTTRTSATVRVSTFSQFGTLYLTWAGITGSPATCTIQIKSSDSVGNLINNGSAISVTPSNGTTSQAFAPAAGLQTSAQMAAVFACGTYPTAGTLTLDFVPQITVSIANTPTVTANAGTGQFNVTCTAATCPINTAQFGGTNVVTGTGASGSGIPRVTISNDSSLAANQSINVAQVNGNTTSTAATGVQKVGIVGNAGAAVDGATNAAPPANAILQGFVAATALPSATTASDTVAPMADKFGRQIVLNNAMRDLIKTTGGVQTTNATQTTLLAAQGAGVFADLVDLFISTETGTACLVAITDGTNTYKVNVANQQGAGLHWNPPTPMPAASSNTAWQVTGCASVTLDYFGEFVLNK
jgi:hypothetical protein